MLRRVLNLLAILMLLISATAGVWWVRSHSVTDAISACPENALVRLDTVPGLLRLELAPDWPYPERVEAGWRSWQHTPETPPPVLGADSTNSLGFGYDHGLTVVVDPDEDQPTSAPAPTVSDYVLILPFWVLVVIPGLIGLMRLGTWRRQRWAARMEEQAPLASDCLPGSRVAGEDESSG